MNNLSTPMDEGCKKIRGAYITKCIEDDYLTLSLIHELRGFLGKSHIINGFNIQEIEFLLDFICTQSVIENLKLIVLKKIAQICNIF